MFIDQARVFIKAGDGGRGAVSFRREKFVPFGGPDGGDGGRGGDIYFKATSRKNTLLDFRYKRHFKAQRGSQGEGGNRSGKSGEDLWIEVPVGTVIYEEPGSSDNPPKEDEAQQAGDLDHDGQVMLIAKGGRGGKGNARFATATAQAPDFAQQGEPGEEKRLRLELKLLADVGLLGLPNAGKSTLLSRISAAKPKIAAYPFTTLQPLLGTVQVDDSSFVVADIPGLIEGAAQGHGLGLQFLRHVERTRLLLHLLDVSDPDNPVQRYRVIRRELDQYGRALAEKPELLVATKMDSAIPENVKKVKQMARRHGVPFLAISAVSGDGLGELLQHIQEMLDKMKREQP